MNRDGQTKGWQNDGRDWKGLLDKPAGEAIDG